MDSPSSTKQKSSELKKLLTTITRTSKVINKRINSKNISTSKIQILYATTHLSNATVSSIARTLKTSRQNISVLIESMIKGRLLYQLDNPKNKRSKLIKATKKGDVLLKNTSKEQNKLCANMGVAFSYAELNIARRTLLQIAREISNN